MADRVRKTRYCYVSVPHRAGRGAQVLAALVEAGVDLLAYSRFPAGGGKAQLEDRLGAGHRHLSKLAHAGVNVTAAGAVTAGRGRYGMLLWVKPNDYAKAAKVLGAR